MTDSEDITVRTDTYDGGLVLQPIGDIDLSRAPAFRRRLADAQASGPSRLVVDLSEVPYMDSSGVATLIEAMQRARSGKQTLVIAAPQHRVKSIFEIARLDSVFTITDTVESAKEV